MGPIAVMAIGLCIFAAGAYWLHEIQNSHRDGAETGQHISFQKYALFWVEIEPGAYQLRAVVKLFNQDSTPYLINSIDFSNISIGVVPRGSTYLQNQIIQTGKVARIDGDNYIEAGKPGFFPVTLPVKFFAKQMGGSLPAIYTFGDWRLKIGNRPVAISPRRTSTYPTALTEKEWSVLLKTGSPIKIDDLDYEHMPPPPGAGPDENFLLFNPDRTARIDNVWFSATPYIEGAHGVMVFVRGRGEPPLDDGWVLLGKSYPEVWDDPEKLALYNSLYAPGADGKPRPFGMFAGEEKAIMGEVK